MQDTARFLAWLTSGWPPETCLELRVLPRRGVPLAGFFVPDQAGLAAAVQTAARWGNGHAQVYCGINPRGSHLLSTARNRLIRTGRAGREEDVVAVTAVLVDIDPRRPKGAASTETELARAREIARAVDRWWREQGWHAPLVAMSGNGYHLWARVPPQDPQTFPAHLRAFLADLARRFGNDSVDVDLAVADAPRIAKVPGVVSIKGENTPDRPWRRAAIVAWSLPQAGSRLAEHITALEPVHHFRRSGAGSNGTTARGRLTGGASGSSHEAPGREGGGVGRLKPRPLLERVLSRCRFVQWAKAVPAAVREPAWYALATNLAAFEGGEEAFYQLSEGYPGYDPREAERKWAHAIQDAPGPTTCRHLADLGELGFQCPLLGVCPVRSPAGLGHVSSGEWAALFGAGDPQQAPQAGPKTISGVPGRTVDGFERMARLAAATHLARTRRTHERVATGLAEGVLGNPNAARRLVHHQRATAESRDTKSGG